MGGYGYKQNPQFSYKQYQNSPAKLGHGGLGGYYPSSSTGSGYNLFNNQGYHSASGSGQGGYGYSSAGHSGYGGHTAPTVHIYGS